MGRHESKCLETYSARKLIANLFWDRKGSLLVDIMERSSTINSAVYYEALRKLRRTNGNAHLHSAVCSQGLLDSYKWELFEHPPYNPDLNPSVYHIFPHMKNG